MKPRGKNNSTTTRTTKENRSLKEDEIKPATIASITPKAIAPSTAPGTLPRPPSTDAINALLVRPPIVGYTVYFAPKSVLE